MYITWLWLIMNFKDKSILEIKKKNSRKELPLSSSANFKLDNVRKKGICLQPLPEFQSIKDYKKYCNISHAVNYLPVCRNILYWLWTGNIWILCVAYIMYIIHTCMHSAFSSPRRSFTSIPLWQTKMDFTLYNGNCFEMITWNYLIGRKNAQSSLLSLCSH